MSPVTQIVASVGSTTIANALGRSANVLLPLTVVTLYGATPETDRFFFVLALAFYFYSSLSYAMTEASVPILVRYQRRVSSQGVFSIGLCTAVVLFIIAGTATKLGVLYSFGFALMAGAGIANGFAAGILHAHAKYGMTGLTWALRFIPLIFFVVSRQSADSLSVLTIGIGIADWIRLAVLLSMCPVSSAHQQVCAPFEYIKSHLSDFIPLSAAMLIMGLNPIIDRLIAGLSGPGSLSILDTGERLFGIFTTLCTLGMMTVLLTRLSQAVSNNTLDDKWPGIIKTSVVWGAIWMTLGVMAGFGMFREWFSNYTPLSKPESAAVQMTYWYYLAGILPFTIGIVYIKRLQATRRYWIIAAVSLCMVALNVPVSLALRAKLGVPGIALATSIVHITHCAVLAACAHRQKYRFNGG